MSFFKKRPRSASAYASAQPPARRPLPPAALRQQPRVLNLDTLRLSAEQRAIVDFVLADAAGGAPVFITGPGGVGKSLVLGAVISALREALGDEAVAVTASTGRAAFDIGGTTLHRFAGVALALSAAPSVFSAALVALLQEKKYARARQRWQRTRVLVVDEVSMVSARTFDNLCALARAAGGVRPPRLIVCGDFLQLPPIARDEPASAPLFAFEAPAWRALAFRAFYLRHPFRQSGALDFAALLDAARLGRLTPAMTETLRARVNLPPPAMASGKGAAAAAARGALGGLVTHVYPLNRDVDAKNDSELARIPGAAHLFVATDWCAEPHHARLLDDVRAPARLTLKVGAQVMLLRNLDQGTDSDDADASTAGLVNGAVGRVAGFAPSEEDSAGGNVPLVLFPTRPGELATVPRRIERVEWEVLDASTAAVSGAARLASRRQLPLNLAYAMSGHKAQGQTLTCAVVADLGSVFEYGQAYVIMSRVKRLEQLFLSAFRSDAILAHPRAIDYYDALAAGN